MSHNDIDITQRLSTGHVSPGFEPLRTELDSYLLGDAGYSAQVAVYHRGELVVDLVGGAELDTDSVTSVFSATKGAAALVIAKLVSEGKLDLDEPVVAYWPEFGAHGKSRVTVAQLLSHQSGVLAPAGGFEAEDLLFSEHAAQRLADSRPLWAPGSAFGYHGMAVGVFMEELTRRVEGRTLKDVYAHDIAGPRDIDFFIGLPEDQDHRYRTIRPAELTHAQRAEADNRPWSPHGLRALALALYGREAQDPADIWFSPNKRQYRALGLPSSTGVGSARGLARLYAAAQGFVGERFVSADALEKMSQQQVWGHDRILDTTMCYATVFMKPMPREDFGSHRAFGHDGGGGAIGFADPEFDLSFAYLALPNQFMGGGRYAGGVLPRPMRLSELARECIQRLPVL